MGLFRLLTSNRDPAPSADQNARNKSVQVAFLALPTPAVLVDATGAVIAVNVAWLRHPGLMKLRAGDNVGVEWARMTSDMSVAEAIAEVIRERRPTQVESTHVSRELRRFLVHVGPAPSSGGGALAVVIDLTSQFERERRLLHDAIHDPLTGVPNRGFVLQRIEEALLRLRRYGDQFALLYLDLNAFKRINDRYGHAYGDEVLREVTRRWSRVIRAPDVLGRVGGDEFVVVIQHAVGPAATHLAARIAASLSEPLFIGSTAVVTTVAIGMATPPGEANAEEALALADAAMYARKQAPND